MNMVPVRGPAGTDIIAVIGDRSYQQLNKALDCVKLNLTHADISKDSKM